MILKNNINFGTTIKKEVVWNPITGCQEAEFYLRLETVFPKDVYLNGYWPMLNENDYRCHDRSCPDSPVCQRFLQRKQEGIDLRTRRRLTLRDRRTGQCDMLMTGEAQNDPA